MLTGRAQRVYDLLNGKPGITKIAGLSDPRPVRNSDKISEHTYGNALDVYGSVDALVFWSDFLAKNRANYDVKVLCYDPGIGRRHDRCTTKHTDHMHIDFGPHCGGNIPASGTGNERVSKCNEFQGGGVPENEFPPGTLGGTLGGIMPDIEGTITKVLIIGLGIVLIAVGAAVALKDTAAVKTAKSAVTKGLL